MGALTKALMSLISWKQVVHFAENYEYTSSENMTAAVPVDAVVKQILMTLGDAEFAYAPPPITQRQIAQMDALFAQNQALAKIMILAHKHLYQKENEHHLVARAQHRIHQKILQIGEELLVPRGIIKTSEQVFDFPIDRLIDILEGIS